MRLYRSGEKGFASYISGAETRMVEGDRRLEREVRSILTRVRLRGDEALLRYTKKFDGLEMSVSDLEIGKEERERARRKIPPELRRTFETAARRIEIFNRALKRRCVAGLEKKEKGIYLAQRTRPLDRVGIYIPGGKASYPSSVLMAAVPAKVAGVPEIIMVTPPSPQGVSPAVLAAADLAGVDRIFAIGGAQAIGALAFGTETIPKVDKIVGPGNQYVAMAKRLVYGIVDIDMVAGPSEIVIICDGADTPASFIAADLISQAEHDEMARAVLLTPSEPFAAEVKREVIRQLSSLPRKRIAAASLNRRGAILIVKDLEEAVDLANRIAPEHLEICARNGRSLARNVKHAGAIFLGPYTPEAIGDYLAGPNHILPTAGSARFSSPLSVEDFTKKTSLLSFSEEALARYSEDVRRFASWEGLEGHSLSVQIRGKS